MSSIPVFCPGTPLFSVFVTKHDYTISKCFCHPDFEFPEDVASHCVTCKHLGKHKLCLVKPLLPCVERSAPSCGSLCRVPVTAYPGASDSVWWWEAGRARRRLVAEPGFVSPRLSPGLSRGRRFLPTLGYSPSRGCQAGHSYSQDELNPPTCPRSRNPPG